MKLLLILLNVFSILSLILAQNTTSKEECQVCNSIANKIYNNSKNVTMYVMMTSANVTMDILQICNV